MTRYRLLAAAALGDRRVTAVVLVGMLIFASVHRPITCASRAS